VKAIGYGRTSGDDQREAATIDMQRAVVPQTCAKLGWEWCGWYEDDGLTGVTLFPERPGAAQLLADAPRLRQQGVTQLLVYDWSRIGREPWVLWGAVYALEQQLGIRIKSCTEDADTSTPEKVLMLCVTGGVATYERHKTMRRSRDAMTTYASQGQHLGGVTPFGYYLEGTGRRALLIPDERPLPGIDPGFGLSPAEAVRTIYRWAGQGSSLPRICDLLNSLGIPPSFRPLVGNSTGDRAAAWMPTRLARLIRNPIYKGERVWGKRSAKGFPPVTGSAPSLVTAEEWEAAQETMARNRRFLGRNTRRLYLLRGLLECDRCGYSLTARTCSGLTYYACWGTYGRSRATGPTCDAPYVGAQAVEALVWDRLRNLLLDPEAELAQLLAERKTPDAPLHAALLTSVEQRLAELATERQRVIAWARQGRITEEDLDLQLGEVVERETTLRREQQRLLAERPPADLEALQQPDIRARLRELSAGIDEADSVLRRELLTQLVDRVVVHTEGRQRQKVHAVKVVWRL